MLLSRGRLQVRPDVYKLAETLCSDSQRHLPAGANRMPGTPSEQRLANGIEELEIKVVYQDRLIEDLDKVVQAFARRVESLEKKLTKIQDTVNLAGIDAGPGHQPPPHY